MSDLMLFSRIDAASSAARVDVVRADSPAELTAAGDLDLVLVDWSARDEGWADEVNGWRAAAPNARLILFGRHTDLAAHAAARAAGIGPMWARSKLVAELSGLMVTAGAPRQSEP